MNQLKASVICTSRLFFSLLLIATLSSNSLSAQSKSQIVSEQINHISYGINVSNCVDVQLIVSYSTATGTYSQISSATTVGWSQSAMISVMIPFGATVLGKSFKFTVDNDSYIADLSILGYQNYYDPNGQICSCCYTDHFVFLNSPSGGGYQFYLQP